MSTWGMLTEAGPCETVILLLRWPVLVELELVALTSAVWAWRSDDGSWFTMRAAMA